MILKNQNNPLGPEPGSGLSALRDTAAVSTSMLFTFYPNLHKLVSNVNQRFHKRMRCESSRVDVRRRRDERSSSSSRTRHEFICVVSAFCDGLERIWQQVTQHRSLFWNQLNKLLSRHLFLVTIPRTQQRGMSSDLEQMIIIILSLLQTNTCRTTLLLINSTVIFFIFAES